MICVHLIPRKSRYVNLPLYYYFHEYDWCVIYWWTTVLGCDISPEESGLIGIDRATYGQALRKFGGKGA